MNDHPSGGSVLPQGATPLAGTDSIGALFSSWSLTPWEGLHGTTPPRGLFFERDHGGVPEISPRGHRLPANGVVGRPTTLDYGGSPTISVRAPRELRRVLGQFSLRREVPTGPPARIAHLLAGTAEWTGMRVLPTSTGVGILPEAEWGLARGRPWLAIFRWNG